ncbi:MAG TPA: hypothetical protein VM554_07130 [Acidisarcina sp.]|nr:hypothetical protein [Acidisarcina sp.]
MKTRCIALNLALMAGLVAAVGVAKAAAQDQAAPNDESRIKQGFAISPVPLNMAGKNRALVGLGSYLVNAVGDCSGCHTNPEFVTGGDPYMHQKKVVNAAHFLAGGQHFGPFVSRNLTPENGLPEGHTFAEFVQIMRTGIDMDHLHPQISDLLQVMPWPTYQNMTDHELRAIYEYLSAIPPATPGP